MHSDLKKNIIKLAAFGGLLLVILVIASAIMTPEKWFDENLIQDRNSRSVQMMEQPEYTIDVMNIGDSLSTAGFTPMELWRQQGFTSFNIGADGLRMAESYYAVVEACDKQAPKYLLIESLYLFRFALGQDMQMSLSHPIYHRSAFLKYHNIWKSLVEPKGVMIYHRGYTVNENVGEYEGDFGYLDLDLDKNNRMTISAYNSFYFDMIKKFCDERGIKIILYSMPSALNYNWERVGKIEEFAKEKRVEYIDLNQIIDQVGIDWEQDTNDNGDHMNLFGAVKVTGYLGNHLKEKADLVDHRGDPAYSDWDAELIEYDQLVEDMEGMSFQDIWNIRKDKEWDEKYKKQDSQKNTEKTE